MFGIKITYDPPISQFYLISINFMEKLIKISLKKLIRNLKIDHLNDKSVILTNYEEKNGKKNRKFFSKKLCKK